MIARLHRFRFCSARRQTISQQCIDWTKYRKVNFVSLFKGRGVEDRGKLIKLDLLSLRVQSETTYNTVGGAVACTNLLDFNKSSLHASLHVFLAHLNAVLPMLYKNTSWIAVQCKEKFM